MIPWALGNLAIVIDESYVGSGLNGWIEFLEREIQPVATAMESELGEQSMCRIHKDDRVSVGLKYQEDRMNAFAEARRVARDAHDIEAALIALRKRWDDELARLRGVEHPAVEWVSYGTGGELRPRSRL